MAQFIGASVGRMGGSNRPEDLVKVHQLLDNVPIGEGGWKGADGRVDPDGPTLAKLNEFDRPFTPVPVTTQTRMQCPHGGLVVGTAAQRPPLFTTSDPFPINNCLFPVSPCVQVKWLGPPGKLLTTGSVGLRVNALGAPAGIVLFS